MLAIVFHNIFARGVYIVCALWGIQDKIQRGVMMDFRNVIISILSGIIFFNTSNEYKFIGTILTVFSVFFILDLLDTEWNEHMHKRGK